MAQRRRKRPASLLVRDDQGLFAIPVEVNGQKATLYVVEEEADKIAEASVDIQEALSVLGAWSDLDWEEAVAELDRIRHESQPTPPITDL